MSRPRSKHVPELRPGYRLRRHRSRRTFLLPNVRAEANNFIVLLDQPGLLLVNDDSCRRVFEVWGKSPYKDNRGTARAISYWARDSVGCRGFTLVLLNKRDRPFLLTFWALGFLLLRSLEYWRGAVEKRVWRGEAMRSFWEEKSGNKLSFVTEGTQKVYPCKR